MDKSIEKKFWSRPRLLQFIGIALVLSVLAYVSLKAIKFNHKVDKSRVQTAKVAYTEFSESIPVSGTVEPLVSIMINALEGGRVEEVFVEEGALVAKGDKLLRISNTALSLDFMNRETQIIEQINNLRNTRIALQQNQRQNEDELLAINNRLKLIERQFLADTMLAKNKAISEIDYFVSKQNFDLVKKQQALANKRVDEDEAYRKKQIHRIDNSIVLMERNLDAIRQHLENLTIKAPITGRLNSFDHDIGANLRKGQNVARIDKLEGYKVSARIDQYYINRVEEGQKATFNYGGQVFSLKVSKVSSTITNGQFEAELIFENNEPKSLTSGQMFQLKIILSATSKAFVIPKGAFFQSTGGQWIFVVDENGIATRREIITGRQSAGQIEIIEGLAENEEVVISSYETYKKHQQIIITKP